MLDQFLTFKEILAPMEAEVFLRDYYRRRPVHIPGSEDRFREVFSWDALNRLLELSPLWTDGSFRLTHSGRLFQPEEYCYSGIDRENKKAMKPDIRQVKTLLRQGATVSLSFVDGLDPRLRSVSQTFEVVLGAEICGTAFASWDRTMGYSSHFDTQNVFAMQIDGAKTWRIYEGRMLNAAHVSGADSAEMSQEHHEQAKGRAMMEVTLTPGDLLYLPHGQYHDATAESGASLHISFGAAHLITRDFLSLLMKDVTKDPLFREHLPHFDDVRENEGHLRRVADRLHQIIADPQNARLLQGYVRDKALSRVAHFELPDRQAGQQFRVRWLGRRLERRDHGWWLNGGSRGYDLEPTIGSIAEWAIERDYFSESLAFDAMKLNSRDALTGGLKRLQEVALIEPI